MEMSKKNLIAQFDSQLFELGFVRVQKDWYGLKLNDEFTGIFGLGTKTNFGLSVSPTVGIRNERDLHHLVVPRQADKSCLLKKIENSVGVKSPSDPCGLMSL